MFTILCPTDFSSISAHALEYAAEIAKRVNGQLHLTHVIHPSYLTVDMGGAYVPSIDLGELREESDKKLEKLAIEFRKKETHVTYSTEYGFWDNVLPELSEKFKPNLLVTGTIGTSSVFAAKLLGMNSLEMAKKINYPILVVPPGYNYSHLEKIAYATDYQFADLEHAQFLLDIVKAQKAQLEFIHVTNKDNKLSDDTELMDWFQDFAERKLKYENTSFTIIVNENTDKAIENYCSDNKIELLCLSMRNKNFIQDFFTHSHSAQFIVEAKVPVFIFHLKESNRLN